MRRLGQVAARMPITVKAPVVVVFLMLAIGIAASERVLSRLINSQERHLGDLANAYLDGLASPLIEPVLRGDPWEVFDILDRAKRPYDAVKPVETVVTDTGGRVLASSNPRHAGVGTALPRDFPVSKDHGSKVLIHTTDARAFIDRTLMVNDRQIGTLHAELDISPLLAERREVLWTLILSNAALTLLLAALGWFAVRRMVAPMKILTEHLEAALSRRTRISIEGKRLGDWVLIDAGDVIIHLFRPDTRTYYNLEKMWGEFLPDSEAVRQ